MRKVSRGNDGWRTYIKEKHRKKSLIPVNTSALCSVLLLCLRVGVFAN